MATYNGALYIKPQIESILKQLHADDELIISDDSSTDNTLEVIKAVCDSRVIILEGNRFRDPIKNFEHALKSARGVFIFLSDQDDVWIDGKYEKMLTVLEEFDLVVSDSIIVDENLAVLHPSFFAYFGSGKGILKNMIRSTYYGSCMAFRQNVLKLAMPFPDTKEIGHDLWIGLVAELTGRVCFLTQPMLLYRRHKNTFSSAGVGLSSRSVGQKFYGRVVMIWELCKFILRNKLKRLKN
ncbi:glycosyltransferase family 2 protein [Arcticibacter svalbardensis]|nr:glycosyltransferase family 2 protein [Arcticibacter svalbardensis]